MNKAATMTGYPKNTPLAWLGTAEQFVTFSARLWHLREGRPADTPGWRDGFIRVGIEREAAPALDMLLQLPACFIPRQLRDFRSLTCRFLGDDEARLLRCIALIQRGARPTAADLLRTWLPPAAARMAMLPADRLARALHSARLVVTDYACGTQHPGTMPTPMPATLSSMYH